MDVRNPKRVTLIGAITSVEPRLCFPPGRVGLAKPPGRPAAPDGLSVAVFVAHTFYALLMDIGPLGGRELDWSAFGDLDPRQPGTVVGVVSGGHVKEWRSFGTAEPFGAPLAPQSVVYVASIAKQFTAASVGLLALDGALGLEDDIRRHIRELPSYPSPVRVGHLLAHTSGLPPGHDLDRSAGMVARGRFSTADRVRVVATAALQAEPGTAHQYSNHGYVLLAELVHRVSGVPLGEFAAARIFGPLGMSHTGFLDSPGCPKPVPGWPADGERLDIAFTCVGDGGLVSCIEDLAHWDGWLPSSPLAKLMLGPGHRSPTAPGRTTRGAYRCGLTEADGSRAMAGPSTATWDSRALPGSQGVVHRPGQHRRRRRPDVRPSATQLRRCHPGRVAGPGQASVDRDPRHTCRMIVRRRSAPVEAADSKSRQGAQASKPRPLTDADGRISTLSSGRPYGVGKADNAAYGPSEEKRFLAVIFCVRIPSSLTSKIRWGR